MNNNKMFSCQTCNLVLIRLCLKRCGLGTVDYRRTKGILYVMKRLGHKNIKNTLIYVQLDEVLFKDEIDYVSKVAKTEAEVCLLIEAGFDFVCDFDGHKLFRKRSDK